MKTQKTIAEEHEPTLFPVVLQLPPEVVFELNSLADAASYELGGTVTRDEAVAWLLRPRVNSTILETHKTCLGNPPAFRALARAKRRRDRRAATALATAIATGAIEHLARIGPRWSLPLGELVLRLKHPPLDILDGLLLGLERDGLIALVEMTDWRGVDPGKRERALRDPQRRSRLAVRITQLGVELSRGAHSEPQGVK